MIDFIINGNAGLKAPLKAKKIISKILDEKGIEYAFHPTKCEKDAIRIFADGEDGRLKSLDTLCTEAIDRIKESGFLNDN